jgi:hypothetical protein
MVSAPPIFQSTTMKVAADNSAGDAGSEIDRRRWRSANRRAVFRILGAGDKIECVRPWLGQRGTTLSVSQARQLLPFARKLARRWRDTANASGKNTAEPEDGRGVAFSMASKMLRTTR